MTKRMPPFHDNCTSKFPRTMRHDGRAIYHYKVRNRWAVWFFRWGWVIFIIAAFLADPYLPIW